MRTMKCLGTDPMISLAAVAPARYSMRLEFKEDWLTRMERPD
jgi:hypothetical protein